MTKKQIALKSFADAVPIACGMIGCVSTVLTANQIEFIRTLLIPYCIFCALMLSLWMNVPKYGMGFGAVFLGRVFLLCAFRMKKIGDGATLFVYRVLSWFPEGITGRFNLDALSEAVAENPEPDTCVTLFIMLVAAAIGFLLAASLLRSKTVLLPLLIPIPMLLASLFFTSSPPALWSVALICVYFGYTLLGNGLRNGDYGMCGRFVALLAPVLLVVLLLIGELIPQKTYEPISAEVRSEFLSEHFGPIVDAAMSWFGVRNPKNVDLSDEGERMTDDTELFSVYARSGTFLLRTHSYGAYRDNSWRAADAYKGDWRSMEALGRRQNDADSTMWILDSISDDRVVPYAWTGEADDTDLAASSVRESQIRSGGWKDYGWRYSFRYRTEAGTPTAEERAYYDDFAVKQYVMPDGEEKDALQSILREAGITRSGDTLATAKAVAAYVRESGAYSLLPGNVPEGGDFVLYFLTENHKGYCVHFASATVALLQALEIPARYTVGYYVQIPQELSKERMPVTKNNEHAWAEVYVLGLGWVPVESTPGFLPPESNEPGGNSQTNPDEPVTTPGAPYTTEPTEGPSDEPIEEPTPVFTPVPPTPDPSEAAETLPPEEIVPKTIAPLEEPLPTQTPSEPLIVDADAEEEEEEDAPGAWWLLVLIPVVPAVWIGVGLLIRKRRETVFSGSDAKRAIPEMAHYLKRLERYGWPNDPEAEKWALEAAFSNHPMEAEHRTLLNRVHKAQRKVCKDKPGLRFLLRWVLYVI